uniref:Solute carrier family 35 member F2-like n=1 Tax=Sinocyclocheilus grahami TaxID=75366 RepID=A0A672S6M5_SINGR
MDREVGENSFEHGRLGALSRWGRFLCGPQNLKFKDMFTWQFCKTIAMGQALSMLICGTAVTCQYLADAGVETPMLQSFLNYTLLLLTYTLVLAFRRGENNIVQILKTKWWKYFLMALTDVEANYTVVKAYQFTTLTSIQLLDCFVIPVLMLLSWIFLKTRYRPLHFIAVTVCLLGVGAMVGADLLAGRDQGSSRHVLLGDGLVLVSAALYAVSNVCQEYTVKNLSRVEFLVLCPPFHFLSLLFVAYTLCMYGLYSFMPVVVNMTSATAVNLSLLTADLFSLFCGMFLFRYNFSGLYIVSFVVITLGFIMFNIVPTYTADQSYATNDRAYHLASSADVQQDIVDSIGSSHGAHCNGFCSPI